MKEKYFVKIKNYLKGFVKMLGSPLFGAILNIVMLVVTIYALLIAKRTLENADEQFRINSFASDSLFNIQLNYSKKLNDSLIFQISSLQEITNKQLRITNEQLIVSREIYKDQLYSGRPIIVLKDNIISDTSVIQVDKFSPNISTIFDNVGKRSAIDVVLRPYIVYSDFSFFRASNYANKSSIIEPNSSYTYEYKPKIDMRFKQNFYYCFVITFYDKILDKTFKQYYYQHYYRDRNVYGFFDCDKDTKVKIKNYLNIEFQSINEPPFEEYYKNNTNNLQIKAAVLNVAAFCGYRI